MKKLISIVLTLVLMLASVSAFAQSHITLTFDGKPLQTDVPPQIVNNRTMVPIRVILEALGLEVGWDNKNQMVYTESKTVNLFMTIGSNKMLVNSEMKYMDTAPYVSGGRTYVSARAVSEALGCTVEWDANTKCVHIKSPGYKEPVVSSGIIGDNPAFVEKVPEYEKELLNLINAERTSWGLGILVYDDALESVAYMHSQDMSLRAYFDHNTPEGIDPFDRIADAGITYGTAAENIAAGFTTSAEVFKAWMNSKGHMENILNENVTKMGVGYYKGSDGTVYWTLVLTD